MQVRYPIALRITLASCLWMTGLTVLPVGEACAASDELVDMIAELVSGSDGEMRILGFQQIREEAPGKAATRRFAEMLPKLQPDVQVQMIDALAERGDGIARPAVLDMLNSETEVVRAMATRALARLGESADVPALARIAATGSDAEAVAARESLKQLHARKVDAAIVEALEDADALTGVELIGALVARDVRDALPAVLKHAEDSDPAVRMAVLVALRAMGDHRQTADIVRMLKSATEKAEGRHAEQALLATCSRGRLKCAAAVVDGFDGASAPVRVSLVRALAEVDGPKALEEVVARLQDEDEAVQNEAVRVLAGWPDAAATPHLKVLAADVDNLRNHVLAIRGLVRRAGPAEGRPADLALLGETLELASRTPEKVLVLGTLGTIATSASLALVVPCLDQPELLEDAAFTAVTIAEKIEDPDKEALRALMTRVAERVQTPATRDRAKQIRDAL